jgi:glutamate-1-semialdehyde 2,1-aminomutase
VAAIVTEPIMCNNGGVMPAPGFLEGLRQRCTARGIMLIFDEVITGFRVGLGGAQGLLGVTPDLAIFSKAMANGMPISCVGGRRDIMDLVAARRVVHAGTFNGNAACVAAALATLDELERDPDRLYAGLFARARRLMEGLRAAAADAGEAVLVQGPGPVFFSLVTSRPDMRSYRDTLDADGAAYARFCAAMLESGIRLVPVGRWYVSLSHTDADVDQTSAAARTAWRQARAAGQERA